MFVAVCAPILPRTWRRHVDSLDVVAVAASVDV